MFVSRTHNENAIYEQQTAAAAKPLNQGVKGLAPKTPAGKTQKTPFRGGKNDENTTSFTVGKGGAKDGKAERDAFVTPANTRVRAPLGNKTTNAKATAFRTPALPATQDKAAKGTSPHARRSKIKIHEAAPETAEDILQPGEEVPDIEYMPPRGIPLPDYPDQDIWPHDRDYSQLQGANLVRGCWSAYAPKHVDEYGHEVDDLLNFDEECRQAEEKERQRAEREKKLSIAPPTLKAKDAASALSTKKPNTNVARPQTAAAGTKSRQPISAASKKTNVPVTSSNPRFTAAKVASKNTIGYSKGRQVSASARRPLSDIHSASPASNETNDTISKGRSLADVLGLSNLDLDDDDGTSLFSRKHEILDEIDDEKSVFQLDEADIL